MKKMKIAYILPSLANKGPIIATRDIIKSLLYNTNVEMTVYYFDDNVELDMLVPAHRISFFEKIDFSIYDVVHSCNIRPDIYLWVHSYFGFSKLKNKMVSSMHNVMSEELTLTYGSLISKIVTPIWILALKAFKFVTVSSNTMFNYYVNFLDSSKLVIIPYGREILEDIVVPEEDTIKISFIKKQYKVIGTIGSLTKRKNTEQVIEFLSRNSDYALISLGAGEELDDLIKLSKSLNLENRVLFLGTRPDSRHYYKYFDIFCLPSRSEGFALVVIDAMAYKLPIILSNLDVYQDILTSEDVAFFDLDNISSFIKAVEYVEQNKIKLIENAFKKYQSIFSIDAYSKQYIGLYNKVMND